LKLSAVLFLVSTPSIVNRHAISWNSYNNLQTSKAPIKSQVQGTSLCTSAASNHRGCVGGPGPVARWWEGQISR